MKRNAYKYIALLIGLAGFFSLQASEKDSLMKVAARMPADTTRLEFIYREASRRTNMYDIDWSRLLLTEAQKQKSLTYEGAARFLLLRYYYVNDTDSLEKCLKTSEPVFLQAGMYEPLFRAKGWYVYALTRDRRQEEVLPYIRHLKEQARELQYPEGLDIADQALANFYIKTGLKSEGIQLYEEVLEKMEREKAPLMKRINILRQLILISDHIQTRIRYLEVLKKHIDTCKKAGIEQLDQENPLYILEYVYYRTFAVEYMNLYMQQKSNGLGRVLPALEKAAGIARQYKQTHYERELQGIYAQYYVLSGKYDQGIALFDSLQWLYQRLGRINYVEEILKGRSQVLYLTGRYKEAADAYQGRLALKDSLTRLNFEEELARLNARRQVDKLELQNQKMEMEAIRVRTQMIFLWSGLAVLAVICGLLGYMVYVVHRFSRQLKAAKEKAEEGDRLKTTFLANMNHEIRTPLNAIVGFSDILVEEDDPEARRQYAEIIHTNNELLQRLVNDVLDISRIESDTIEFSYSEVHLPGLMKSLYSVVSLHVPEGVELLLDPCLDVEFYTDRNRLMQILTNFLMNATKHTKKGYICFGYEVIDENIHFYVKDTGEGIPKEKWENIFSRFVKLTEWTTGVGLGLAISKALVTKMNGRITVASEVGKGSTFCAIFPLKS